MPTNAQRSVITGASRRTLRGALEIDTIIGLSDEKLGFGGDGRPLDASGQPVADDVSVRFTNGAEIVVRAGSGRSEVIWP